MESTCHDIRPQLSAWLDGELTAEARAAVAAHVDRCAGCRRELGRLAALDAALASLTAPALPRLTEKVLARLPRRRRPWWQSLSLAASLVLGLVLGGSMARDFYPLAPEPAGAEIAALEAFQDFPQGSLGTILASYQPEEGNGS